MFRLNIPVSSVHRQVARRAGDVGIFNPSRDTARCSTIPVSEVSSGRRNRRPFHTSSPARDFHFDTHHFVQRLEREGLNRAQAEGIMSAMAEVIDESIRNMTSNMVTKADQEKHQYTQKVDFAQLKSELQLMEKNDLSMMKTETDRVIGDLDRLKQRLREEITRTQAGVRLDLNLEKGRMREESSGQELKIKEVDTRIEREIADLRTTIQASKATTLQYLVGFVTGCSALLMAYLRFRL